MAVKPVVKKKSTAKSSTTGAKKPTVKKSSGAKKPAVKKGTSTAKASTAKSTNATKNLKKPDGDKIAEQAAEAQEQGTTTGVAKKGTEVSKTPKRTDKNNKSSQRVQSVNWPVDEDGVPMAQISFTASDLIPTGKFANVTVGPCTITKFVRDGDGDHLAAELNDLADTVEVKVLSEQREIVHAGLKAGNAPDED